MSEDNDGVMGASDDFGDVEFDGDFSTAGEVSSKALSVEVPDIDRKDGRTLTLRQKAIRVMVRRAGVETIPELSSIMRGKGGEIVKISDIGIFIGEPLDELMAELAVECKIPNQVNLSAEVVKSRVVSLGAQILEAGRMYQPIQVARIKNEEGSSLECTSGRHRLVALALVYGAGSEIPVYIENMTLNEARDAVVVANQARPTKAMERAEHAVLRAVSGDVGAEQEELYNRTAKTKAKARKYCVYSVLSRGYPKKLSFKVSMTSSRKDGGLTTLTNVENFLGNSLEWNKDMKRKDFDKSLEGAVSFLNAFAKELQKADGFDPSHHMSSMAMSAVGKYYKTYREITGNDATEVAGKVAGVVVDMGEIGRQKSEATYNLITKAMRS